MADTMTKSPGSLNAPAATHKHPRRTSPENSITLRHHRLAREASKRATSLAAPPVARAASSPRRNDSDESNETGASDPKNWFDMSNANAQGLLDSTSMEIDPPFFQKETDSSNEEGAKYPGPLPSPSFRIHQALKAGLLRPSVTHSSSADDFRSVIDDLTVENKRLREELKRYRQMGPDSLRRDKLFEVKIHGLPSRKRRELEATLRDFTTSLDGSSAGASPNRNGGKGLTKGDKSSQSKHASSSSGSNSRPNPTDSAYASMSTEPSSSHMSVPNKRARQNSSQAVEQYLQDIPEGLRPKRMVLSESDKKRLVVRRLEQLFTGKGIILPGEPLVADAVPSTYDVEMTTTKVNPLAEPTREAQILSRTHVKASHSRDNGSANSNGDQTESRDNGNGSGSGSGSGGRRNNNNSGNNNNSPEDDLLPQQRPTRPRDLDPDRAQVPTENMDYLRHLGLKAPQAKQFSSRDVSSDAEGWVYLNLLGNLAQLHIFNVTSDFIRAAVSEKSTQFQLSPDGRKIRWRGGQEGTRFTSDMSGSDSQRESDDTDGSNEHDPRKKQKTHETQNDVIISEPSKFGPQVSSSSDSFHYKPLFVHQQTSSSEEQPSADETGSSYGGVEESNLGITSKWNQSGISGFSQRKRRRDGAIIYYNGAPFCTDLSGDVMEASTDTADDLDKSNPAELDMAVPKFERTLSGSSIPFRPLSSLVSHHAMMDLDFATPDLVRDVNDTSDELEGDFPWSHSSQSTHTTDFEASGLAGIYPEDNFVVFVSTKRPTTCLQTRPSIVGHASTETIGSGDATDSIASRLAALTTGGLLGHSLRVRSHAPVQIDYLSGKIRKLPPAPLPPPSYFFNASTDSDSESDSDSWSDGAHGDVSRQRSEGRVHTRDVAPMSVNEELSSGDEEGDDDDEEAFDSSGNSSRDKSGNAVVALGMKRQASGLASNLSKITRGSSAATAGGARSSYSSAGEA